MNAPTADRNLLFGILGLQMDFIDRDQLVEAMNAWVLDKTKSLGTIREGRNALMRVRGLKMIRSGNLSSAKEIDRFGSKRRRPPSSTIPASCQSSTSACIWASTISRWRASPARAIPIVRDGPLEPDVAAEAEALPKAKPAAH